MKKTLLSLFVAGLFLASCSNSTTTEEVVEETVEVVEEATEEVVETTEEVVETVEETVEEVVAE